VVSPARELPLIALKKGATVIEINRDSAPLTTLVALPIRGKAAEILPQLWKNFYRDNLL
jgi:NAD-dependent SIR2 family protein deacetylase